MSGKSFFKGLLTGAVVGAAVGVATGLLNAPKSGKELRKDLEDYTKVMKMDVEKLLKNAKKISKETYEKAVDEVTVMYDKVKNFDKKDLNAIKETLLDGWDSFSATVLNTTKSQKELRAELSDFVTLMRVDVEKILKTTKKVTEEVYEKAVNDVTEMYNKVRNFDKEDLSDLKAKLMEEWEAVVKKVKA